MTERKEILGEQVPVEEKLFSIYELHTDIIVKEGEGDEVWAQEEQSDC